MRSMLSISFASEPFKRALEGGNLTNRENTIFTKKNRNFGLKNNKTNHVSSRKRAQRENCFSTKSNKYGLSIYQIKTRIQLVGFEKDDFRKNAEKKIDFENEFQKFRQESVKS